MRQGAVSAKVPQLPIVHLAQLVETGTWLVIGGAIAGAAVALLIRWCGRSWQVADLGSADSDASGGRGGMLPQIAGNIEMLLCGRQNMPASAELVAAIAGTRGAWITTQQTRAPTAGLVTGLGSRSRGREYVIHPDRIKSLDVADQPERPRSAPGGALSRPHRGAGLRGWVASAARPSRAPLRGSLRSALTGRP